ncbi:MAG: DUF1674 domain-containing protein [Sphingomonadales bacterium]|nr:DUF1674 domain-containing protein [Sphingomonadales bacterium]
MEKSKGKKSQSDKSNEESEKSPKKQEEFGGPKGLEPSRYGDWERKGIVSDF